jgi:hypothetical protein
MRGAPSFAFFAKSESVKPSGTQELSAECQVCLLNANHRSNLLLATPNILDNPAA